jgi:hypothetical protein
MANGADVRKRGDGGVIGLLAKSDDIGSEKDAQIAREKNSKPCERRNPSSAKVRRRGTLKFSC